ncbi:MAG: hypothetical protein ACLU8D_10030 [Enterocloster sp.]
MNKEKLIFVFCSGLLLFVLSMPGTEKERSLEAAAVGSGGMENMDRSGTGRLLDGPADGPEKGGTPGPFRRGAGRLRRQRRIFV